MSSLPRIHRAFTIIELLVVVSIIAALIGILLPAVGKARDVAQLSRSRSNLKQIGAAHAMYAAEFSDRQVTWCNDYLSRYGLGLSAFTGYQAAVGESHPNLILGYGVDALGEGTTWHLLLAIENITPYYWPKNFGTFRVSNGRALSTYLNGRFYDPIYYAPKDTAVIASVEKWFDHASEYVPNAFTGGFKWSSYCMSPAAMFNPTVFSYNSATQKYWTDPWTMPAGFKSPSMSQAVHADLKSHVIEHHWLQNRKKTCNPAFAGGAYDGCTPYFFNASEESNTATLFYDGHVAGIGAKAAQEDCLRVAAQNGDSTGAQGKGLWSIHQPNGGGYIDGSVGGYFMAQAIDPTATSHTMFTIDGIRGRDILPR
jgi:prepilin-type N-terminal cleavage/methylation domain-containing protein